MATLTEFLSDLSTIAAALDFNVSLSNDPYGSTPAAPSLALTSIDPAPAAEPWQGFRLTLLAQPLTGRPGTLTANADAQLALDGLMPAVIALGDALSLAALSGGWRLGTAGLRVAARDTAKKPSGWPAITLSLHFELWPAEETAPSLLTLRIAAAGADELNTAIDDAGRREDVAPSSSAELSDVLPLYSDANVSAELQAEARAQTILPSLFAYSSSAQLRAALISASQLFGVAQALTAIELDASISIGNRNALSLRTPLVHTLVLSQPNTFGSTSRFTDDTGAQLYSSGIIIDHLYNMLWSASTQPTAQQATAISNAAVLTISGRTGWDLPTRRQIETIIDVGASPVLSYAPFNFSTSFNMWLRDISAANSANGWLCSNTSGNFSTAPRTNNYVFMVCQPWMV